MMIVTDLWLRRSRRLLLLVFFLFSFLIAAALLAFFVVVFACVFHRRALWLGKESQHEKRFHRSLEEEVDRERAASVSRSLTEAGGVPLHASNNSTVLMGSLGHSMGHGSSPFGPLVDVASAKTLVTLIATLNAAFPDYEFSKLSVQLPHHARRRRCVHNACAHSRCAPTHCRRFAKCNRCLVRSAHTQTIRAWRA